MAIENKQETKKEIKVNLDLLMVQRKMSLTQLSEKVGITMANLSILKLVRLKQFGSQL